MRLFFPFHFLSRPCVPAHVHVLVVRATCRKKGLSERVSAFVCARACVCVRVSVRLCKRRHGPPVPWEG